MILTKGFKDLLTMRHLARPNIFDLKCERKIPLFSEVIEADERVFLKQPPP
jgi:N-methylhydantoinase A/oxoprolinase/acetone carboxylase beta subunit